MSGSIIGYLKIIITLLIDAQEIGEVAPMIVWK